MSRRCRLYQSRTAGRSRSIRTLRAARCVLSLLSCLTAVGRALTSKACLPARQRLAYHSILAGALRRLVSSGIGAAYIRRHARVMRRPPSAVHSRSRTYCLRISSSRHISYKAKRTSTCKCQGRCVAGRITRRPSPCFSRSRRPRARMSCPFTSRLLAILMRRRSSHLSGQRL